MLVAFWQFTVHTTVCKGLLYFWGKTPEHSCTRGQVGSTVSLDITLKAVIHAPSTKWTLVTHSVATQFAHSAILTDTIYLYHTNPYLKSISFPWMSGRLPVKLHTSTLKVTLSPTFIKSKAFFICLLSGPWNDYIEACVNQANSVVHSFFDYHA